MFCSVIAVPFVKLLVVLPEMWLLVVSVVVPSGMLCVVVTKLFIHWWNLAAVRL